MSDFTKEQFDECRKATQSAIVAAITLGHEVCIAAAIMFNDQMWIGHRHGHAMQAARDGCDYYMNRREMGDKGLGGEQGFVTSHNRYVTREEGRKLQDAAGIPSAAPDGYRYTTLFSEDLH